MLLLNDIEVIDLFLSLHGEYIGINDYDEDMEYDDLVRHVYERIIDLQGLNLRNNALYDKGTLLKTYEMLLPELKSAGVIKQDQLKNQISEASLQSIENGNANFYIKVLTSDSPIPDWEELGSPDELTIEEAEEQYEIGTLDKYKEYLKSWDNLLHSIVYNDWEI